MYIKFGWGKDLKPDDLKYVCTGFNLSFSSSEEYGVGLGNCLPSQIGVTLEVEASFGTKPAEDIFNFAKNQHSDAKTKGGAMIVVYPEQDVGQAIQQIDIDDAWITNISTGAGIHDNYFTVQLAIMAAKVTISGVEFVDKRRAKLLSSIKT
jgi:hypothetical protein